MGFMIAKKQCHHTFDAPAIWYELPDDVPSASSVA